MDTEPLLLAAVGLLAGAGGRMDITNLNKALFYLDLVRLRDEGEVYSRARFVAIDFGPVVEDYKVCLVNELKLAGLGSQGTVGMSRPVILAEDAEDRVALEPAFGRLAHKLGSKFAPVAATILSLESHKNLGYIAALNRGKGSPINMILAMQQIIDTDPWLDESFPEATLAELAIAEREDASAL